MVGEAFRAVAGPEVEFRATSKRLETQLRRGFFVSQGARGHSVDQRVVRDFVRTAHDYSEAFTCHDSSSGSCTLADSAERSATGVHVGPDYALFTGPFNNFEGVSPIGDDKELNWKVKLSDDAKKVRKQLGLVARFRRSISQEPDNDQRRYEIAQYYFGLAARIYGVQNPIFEQLLIADFLHHRAQDLQAQDAIAAFKLSLRMHAQMGQLTDPVRAGFRSALAKSLRNIDGTLMDDAGSAWRRFLAQGVANEDEERVASIVYGSHNGKHISYTYVDSF